MQLHQKIINLLAQLALLKYQSLQGGVKEMYAKEEIEGALIQGKVSRTVFDHDEDLKITWQSFHEKICRASSAIVSPTAETGSGNLHKELKLRIRPGKYCKVLATRDGGERRPCFITRFLETLRYDQFNGQPAEKQTCGSHSSRGFVVGGSSIKRFFWIRHRWMCGGRPQSHPVHGHTFCWKTFYVKLHTT